MAIKRIVLLLIAFIVYSFTGVFSKLASQNEFLSVKYVGFFVCVILMLGIYAILWQKILSFIPLHKAFLCKSICIIITLALSYFFFAEELTLSNILGAVCIISGIVVLSWQR